ncbi:MAG: hypothetical protein QOF98_722, partial [Streptomyces sp.]|nr:hypothetical protein [Streptomyces sp.]
MDSEKRISLRLPADLHARLATHAQRDRRSLNSEIVHLLEVALSTHVVDAEPPGSESATR